MDISHEGARSPSYPDTETQIALDATDYGLMHATFEFALFDHGNDRTATWPCFASDEQFSVSYEGLGTTKLEGSFWGIWLVSFEKQEKPCELMLAKIQFRDLKQVNT